MYIEAGVVNVVDAAAIVFHLNTVGAWPPRLRGSAG
jgi:hypothetical protein